MKNDDQAPDVGNKDGLAGGDRELDALIAEHLFGWRWMERGMPLEDKIVLFPSADSELMNPGNWRDVTDEPQKAERFRDWARDVPRYSTDGNAMLAVLDKMREGDWVISMSLGLDLVTATSCQPACSFLSVKRNIHARVNATTLPQAVCRAALEAILTEPANAEPC